MSNLSEKFASLDARLAEIKASIGALSADIGALRGDGEENTIRSINQSIWNVAGPAPGRSLLEIYELLSLIRLTNNSQLSMELELLKAVGIITGYPQGHTVRELLAQLRGVIDSIPPEYGVPPPHTEPGLVEGYGYRVTSWVQISATEDYTNWKGIWATLPAALERSASYSQAMHGGSAVPTGSWWVSWDWTQNTDIDDTYISAGYALGNNPVTIATGEPIVMHSGRQNTLTVGLDPPDVYFCINVRWPGVSEPIRNVWINADSGGS